MQKSFQLYNREKILHAMTLFTFQFLKNFFFCYELFDVSVYCCNLVDSLDWGSASSDTVIVFKSISTTKIPCWHCVKAA